MIQEQAFPTIREMDSFDWSAFTDAQGWDHTPPIITDGHLADGKSYMMAIDRNGGHLLLDDEQVERGGYLLTQQFASQDAAKLFAHYLLSEPTREALFAAGFKAVQ